MATKTNSSTAASGGDTAVEDPPAPAPAPLAAALNPSIFEYQNVWVYHYGVAEAKNQVGFVTVLRTDAATMLANGDAVDPYTTKDPLPYISAKPAPPPVPVPVVVSFLGFSGASPAQAFASTADVAKLAVGDLLSLVQTGGAALAALTEPALVVDVADPNFVLLDLDLTGQVITDVTATGTVIEDDA